MLTDPSSSFSMIRSSSAVQMDRAVTPSTTKITHLKYGQDDSNLVDFEDLGAEAAVVLEGVVTDVVKLRVGDFVCGIVECFGSEYNIGLWIFVVIALLGTNFTLPLRAIFANETIPAHRSPSLTKSFDLNMKFYGFCPITVIVHNLHERLLCEHIT